MRAGIGAAALPDRRQDLIVTFEGALFFVGTVAAPYHARRPIANDFS